MPLNRSAVALLLTVISATCHATIFDFTFNSGWQDLLRGYVDTERNALFVTDMIDWYPGAHHYLDPLQPDLAALGGGAAQEWELRAVNVDGSVHDVPLNWDGVVGGTWGFASAVATEDVPYLNGDYVGNAAFRYYMSIGINKLLVTSVNKLLLTAQSPSVQHSDGSFYAMLNAFAARDSYPITNPTGPADFPDEVRLLSSSGYYVVTRRVPEPAVIGLYLVGLLGLWSARLIKRTSIGTRTPG